MALIGPPLPPSRRPNRVRKRTLPPSNRPFAGGTACDDGITDMQRCVTKRKIGIGLAVVLAGAGAIWVGANWGIEQTDDAQLQSHLY